VLPFTKALLQTHTLPHTHRSLELLGKMQLVNASRAPLFLSYLHLTLHDNMHPQHVVAVRSEVVYYPLASQSALEALHIIAPPPGGYTRGPRSDNGGILAGCNMTDVERLSGVCKDMWEREVGVAGAVAAVIQPNCPNFSFVEYGSGVGVVSMSLAALFPGTFLRLSLSLFFPVCFCPSPRPLQLSLMVPKP